jgi:hypothetical protein
MRSYIDIGASCSAIWENGQRVIVSERKYGYGIGKGPEGQTP